VALRRAGCVRMIVRAWRGRAPLSKPDAYPKHFHDNVVPELHDVPGFLGASLLRLDDAGHIEFLVLTRWISIDAIKAFAGADVSKAVVEPGAVAALADYDRTVSHYTVVEETTV
jgi:heme-degrading monooxygenase HmoA